MEAEEDWGLIQRCFKSGDSKVIRHWRKVGWQGVREEEEGESGDTYYTGTGRSGGKGLAVDVDVNPSPWKSVQYVDKRRRERTD